MSKPTGTKVIVFNVPSQGHINPTFPVVAELVRRGAEVIYYLTESYRERIEATGATFRAYDQVRDDYFDVRNLDGSNPPGAAKALMETSQAMLLELLDIVRKEQPSVIMYDSMCPWGWHVAKILNIPSASSMSLLAFTPGMMLKSGDFFKIVGNVLSNAPSILKVQRTAAEIERAYGVKTPGFPDVLNSSGTITLSYTSAMFQPNAERFPHITFVGPSIEPRVDTTNFPFEQLGTEPLIYISLGTVINENREFYEQCFKAFKDTDYQVVMSVGKRIDIATLGAIPANFIVRSFVPQLDILQRASLFITHAGMNSVHEGLYYNVPLLLVPQQSEQRFVAGRVEELGAGVMIAKAATAAEALRDATLKISRDGRYRERATAVGESLRTAGGHVRAADAIMALNGSQ
jgi:MGT family glycosyltransferase